MQRTDSDHQGGPHLRPHAKEHSGATIQSRTILAKPSGKLSQCFRADDLASRYHFPNWLSGRGECIGVLSFGGGISGSDLTRYFEPQAGVVPDVRYENVAAHNRPNLNSQHDLELALDLQIIGRLAPASRMVVYFGSNDEQGWIDTVTRAVYDRTNQPSILSVSWGATEDWWKPTAIETLNDLFEDAARLGLTICAASGDQGCAWDSDGYCRVTFPASSPFVLACGGTVATNEDIERVWNVKNTSASGGGISDHIPRPYWQPVLSEGLLPGTPCRRRPEFDGRRLPDVSALAGQSYTVYAGGRYQHQLGGTSAVAPLWAALIARLNEGLRHQGLPRIGHFSRLLYHTQEIQQCFRSVTEGHNDPFGDNGYRACRGWNFCTGWGSPDGTRLLETLIRTFEARTLLSPG